MWQGPQPHCSTEITCQDDLLSASAHDLLDNCVRNALGSDYASSTSFELLLEWCHHRRRRKGRVHARELDFRCVVEDTSLLLQTLVETPSGDFSVAVWHKSRSRSESSHRCNGHHMTFLILRHGRKELLNGIVMRNDVDIEHLAQTRFTLLQNRSLTRNTSIVDQDTWIAMFASDVLRDFSNLLAISHITLVVVNPRIVFHVGGEIIANIQCNDVQSSRRKVFGHETSETSCRSGNDYDFLWPVISVLLRSKSEIVLRELREPCVGLADEADCYEPFERCDQSRDVFWGEILAELGEEWLSDAVW